MTLARSDPHLVALVAALEGDEGDEHVFHQDLAALERRYEPRTLKHHIFMVWYGMGMR